MKRDFLKKTIPDITDEQLNAVMAENGRDIEAGNTAREQLAAAQQEITGLKQQITTLNGNIETLKKTAGDNDEAKKQIEQMQADHKKEVEALNQKLDSQARDHAAEKFFANVKFSSEHARRAIIADFKTKGFELKDGAFVGADGYLDTVKKDDPAAFAEEKKPDDKPDAGAGAGQGEGGKPLPRFTEQITNNGNSGGTPNPFKFNFTSVRNAAPTTK